MDYLGLGGSPYVVEKEAENGVVAVLKSLEERVGLLRSQGTLTEETVKDYYGEKRFEQVAESNAIEGSTLSAGETEAAILKGVTITGHDPAYVRDAKALYEALQQLVVIARENAEPTNISQLLEIHSLILGDRPGAGVFRKEPVRISGSEHTPPQTWKEVMDAMEEWEKWSNEHAELPAPVRSAVLHAWLSHVHPFLDGNGRCARAITNLELVRAGYPPIIIKKKERDRYIESLSESDPGGDIRSFIDLVFERLDGALIGLEFSAKRNQGYSPVQEKIRQKQKRHLQIWNASVELLFRTLEHSLQSELEPIDGGVRSKYYEPSLDLDEYLSLCQKQSVQSSWAFKVEVFIPGLGRQIRLAFIGFRSSQMYHRMGDEGGPSLHWSKPNPEGFPKWIAVTDDAPYAVELTTKSGEGDEWYAKKSDGTFEEVTTSRLANKIAKGLIDSCGA